MKCLIRVSNCFSIIRRLYQTREIVRTLGVGSFFQICSPFFRMGTGCRGVQVSRVRPFVSLLQ
ncbi:hypothetical protein M6B38_122340 [Iris pallida]|uniref:Uncharacterized protein n=1 Tax=Iris pallida TaxID=29817 RepID=A0AAX6HAC1_IRIPA|nr:hypothetical protein M6B38_122340 [Iris pallida]